MTEEKSGFWSSITTPITTYAKDMVMAISLLGISGVSWTVAIWILETIADISL